MRVVPVLVFLACVHEIHGVDEVVHRLHLFFGWKVWVRGDALAFLRDEVFERGEWEVAHVLCERYL